MLIKCLTLASLLAISTAASAVTVSFSQGTMGFQPGDTPIADFDTTDGGVVLTGAGTGIYQGTTSGVAAAPAGDTTKYLAVLQDGSATFSFANAFKNISLDVGSVDSYNSLTLVLLGATPVTLTGSQIIDGIAANGDQQSAANNGRLTLTGGAGQSFTGLQLTTSQNSFEIDNLAVSGAVPEPASWAMMIGGFGMVGGAMRRRTRTNLRFA